ncbi:MAG: hypothetical protein ACK4NN_03240 [Rheinheimera sp.]
MTKIELTPRLMMFSALLLLAFSAHLWSRVWVPLPADERTIEQFVAQNVLLEPTAVDALLTTLDNYAPANQQAVDDNIALQKFDGKQLGDLYVSLFGIYKAEQQLKAILQIQDKTANTTVLRRVGVDEQIDELHILDLNTRQIKIRYQQQDVTLVLFVKSNEAASVEP